MYLRCQALSELQPPDETATVELLRLPVLAVTSDTLCILDISIYKFREIDRYIDGQIER